MPLGRKRSVLISLCVNSCVFWQRPWKEGLKTINILSTMSYCYHIVESHQDFGTILTGDQQCNLGKPGCFITETVLNLDLGRNRLGLNVQTIYLAPDLSCSFFISVILIKNILHFRNWLEHDIENKVRNDHQDVFSFSSLPHKPNPTPISFT